MQSYIAAFHSWYNRPSIFRYYSREVYIKQTASFFKMKCLLPWLLDRVAIKFLEVFLSILKYG